MVLSKRHVKPEGVLRNAKDHPSLHKHLKNEALGDDFGSYLPNFKQRSLAHLF